MVNLDEKGKTTRKPVDDPLLTSVRHKIREAGEALRTNKLPRLPIWDEPACGSCDLVGLCRIGQRADLQTPSAARASNSLPGPFLSERIEGQLNATGRA